MNNRNFLRLIVGTSLVAVISLSCFSIFFLSPSFTNLITKSAESEAVKIGRHLAESFHDIGQISKDLPQGFIENANHMMTDFGLMKIKVFAPDGETVFSSSKEDIGKINGRDYFHDLVAQGQVFSKVIKKNSTSLEDQVVSVDVVETYVPVIHAGNFAGAFEVYFDITENKSELDWLLLKSHSLLLLIAAGLMLSVLFIAFIARRSFIKQNLAENKIIQQSLDLQVKNSDLQALNDVSRVLSRSIDLETLLPLVLETIVDKLPVPELQKKGGIMLVDGEKMKLVAHLGHDETFIKEHKNISIHDCLCGLAARSGDIVLSRNSHSDSRHTFSHGDLQPHGHIIVPLKSANKVVGVLYLYIPADIDLQEFSRNLLESMAAQVGIAIDNARLHGETKKMACYDSLTGLANRRFMVSNLEHAIAMAERYDKPFCVAMFDIDYFKIYNDTKGHDAGDKLLVWVAEKIAGSIRDSDLAARYGGEEFLLILPESDIGGAYMAVDRIRQKIAETLEITVSAGVAIYKIGDSIEDLIKMADEALYRAKNNGKDRVECF